MKDQKNETGTGLAGLSTRRLLSRRRALAARLGGAEQVLSGSLTEQTRRCGKPGCRCAGGQAVRLVQGAAGSETSPGSQWPPSWNHRRALACSVSSTHVASALSTSVLAVRWSGRQDLVSPSACVSRWVT